MATLEVPITHIAEARNLRLIAVQLDSPFRRGGDGAADLRFDPIDKVAVWNNQSRAVKRRIDKVGGILQSLDELYANQDLDVVVFPEYSVPQRAHESELFQAFADRHKCILIPGTYVEDRAEETALYRRNLCRIYRPADAPLLIGKHVPTPAESEFVEPYHGANVARFVWTPPGRQAVSISIFICRDYLTPYSPAPNAATDPRHVLDVDWDREGLNIAVAHTEETRQFEAAAGLDLRNLRGRRKMTFLVNNAGCSRELGTALFGPAFNRERDDVVRSLPADQEAILSAEVRLWDIRAAVERPDRAFDEPVASVTSHAVAPSDSTDQQAPSVESIRRHRIVADAGGMFAFQDIEDQVSAPFRGVWRTPFLAAEGLGLSMEFYKARRLSKAVAIVRAEVHDAYAGIVRGEYDLLVRRYPRLEEMGSSSGPDFRHRLDSENRRAVNEAFDIAGNGGVMKVSIFAHDIWKYRGQCVIEEDFERSRRSLSEPLRRSDGRRRELIAKILQYAEGCDEQAGPSDDIRPFFHDRPEEVIAVRPVTELRETFIFLDVDEDTRRESSRFEREVLKDVLMIDDRVREIFKVSKCEHGPFNYLTKLKCKAHEADEIGQYIRSWTEEKGIDCGMRTVDIFEYLCRNSVPGIEVASQGKALREFVEKLRSGLIGEEDRIITRLIASRTDLDVVTSCADAWFECQEAADTDQTLDLRDEILTFFGNVLLYSADQNRKYYTKAADSWLHIYQALEDITREKMQDLHCRCFGRDEPVEFLRHDDLMRRFFPNFKADQWAIQREQTVKVAQRLLQEVYKGTEIERKLKDSARDLENSSRELRNAFAHNKSAIAQEMLNLRGSDPAKVGQLTRSVKSVVTALDLILQTTSSMPDVVFLPGQAGEAPE